MKFAVLMLMLLSGTNAFAQAGGGVKGGDLERSTPEQVRLAVDWAMHSGLERAFIALRNNAQKVTDPALISLFEKWYGVTITPGVLLPPYRGTATSNAEGPIIDDVR